MIDLVFHADATLYVAAEPEYFPAFFFIPKEDQYSRLLVDIQSDFAIS